MARYIKDLVLNKPEDFVTFMMNDYLQKNQFSRSDWKGEPVYRAGDALMEGYKFIKWSYSNGVLHLEAWLKGYFGKEMNLNGFVAALQKKPFRESLEQLFHLLQQDIAKSGNRQGAAAAVPVQTVDDSKSAVIALVLGILSVISAFWIPLVGFCIAVVGFSRARLGSGSNNGGLAKAGKVLCIIGAVVSVVLWALNFIVSMGALRMLF